MYVLLYARQFAELDKMIATPPRFQRPPDALRPQYGQAFAMQVEIDEGEVRAEPVMVLRDAPVSHLVEAEDAF